MCTKLEKEEKIKAIDMKKEEKVIKGVIIMNKKKKRNLRSKDRRAPTRVVAASTPPFRWQGH